LASTEAFLPSAVGCETLDSGVSKRKMFFVER